MSNKIEVKPVRGIPLLTYVMEMSTGELRARAREHMISQPYGSVNGNIPRRVIPANMRQCFFCQLVAKDAVKNWVPRHKMSPPFDKLLKELEKLPVIRKSDNCNHMTMVHGEYANGDMRMFVSDSFPS